MPSPTSTLTAHPWQIKETHLDSATHFLHETLFALGNGYIGLRACPEEGYTGPHDSSLDGSYLNGFYETEPITYPENAYGLARNNQFMLNVPNAKSIELWVGDERFDPLQGSTTQYARTLDFRTGVLVRTLEWTSPQGRRLHFHSRRLVSFEHKHLFALEVTITPLNFSDPVKLVSLLDGEVRNQQASSDPRLGSGQSGTALELIALEQEGSQTLLTQRTRNSGLTLVTAIDSVCDGLAGTPVRQEQRAGHAFEQAASVGQLIRLTKFGVYYSSRDYAPEALAPLARAALAQARAMGFDALCTQQQRYLTQFWAQADVEIAGDDALQQGIRFNQFHLLQSAGRDGKTNIAAKGVTGEGYEGHYFWDTEIYIFPFFLFSKPEIAASLLEYRYAGLPHARERAREMGHAKGALYPWRTIAGEECSAYFPAGTAQYHINADIAYSIKLYYSVTGDLDYMARAGAEIVVETARIWIGIGNYDAAGRFCINEVTGPDEYSALVNNNYYTNAMAQMHLRFAAEIVDALRNTRPDDFAHLTRATGLDYGEVAEWLRAACRMALPYHVALGIHQQDDSFLSKKRWDFAGTPAEKYPLLLHYHPLVIYRHQVSKQADVVLALLLLSDQFTPEDKRRDFDYYEAVTTHDSSLSSCIFSIIAAEVGYAEKAYDYFIESARLDLDDTHGNTRHGVHTAAMAGTWMGVAFGFAGMRVTDGDLRFAPSLPSRWSHYQFRVHVKDALLQVRVDREQVTYSLLKGASLKLTHRDQGVTLNAAQPSVTKLQGVAA